MLLLAVFGCFQFTELQVVYYKHNRFFSAYLVAV